MWKTQFVDGSKFIAEDQNLLPLLLSELNPKEKIVISTIGGGIVNMKNKNKSMKRKGLQSIAKLNLGK